MAIAARIPRIATTIISSTSENPVFIFGPELAFILYVLLIPTSSKRRIHFLEKNVIVLTQKEKRVE